jgi:leader peptidase (prepilin peptidase)/N-methyltransferase
MPLSLEVNVLALLAAAPCFGSFGGLLAERLPAARPVLFDRSRCAACGTVLGARDLVPILSWLLARGRCRHCGARIGWQPLLFELAALLVALWAASLTEGWTMWVSAGLGWTLLVLAVIDQRHMILPDVLTLPLVLAGLLVTWLAAPDLLLDHALAAVLGWALFRALAWSYQRLRGQEGLGAGDAKLLGAAGAWLGWVALPSVVLLAALSGLSLALVRGLFRGGLDHREPLPFGPHLCLGFWLVWLYGPLSLG